MSMQNDRSKTQPSRPVKRQVEVDLIEQTPGAGAGGHWLLASPLLLFLAWLWLDLVAYASPLPQAIDLGLGLLLYLAAVVVPFGNLAHRAVTALPAVFQHAGWDIQPREPIAPNEQYLVSYRYLTRRRAPTNWARIWLRAGQGWVFLEIAAIFVGAIAMTFLFFSASEFGFGR